MNVPDISIIGTGAVGSALARACCNRSMRIKSVYNRSADVSKALAKKLDIAVSGNFPEDIGDLGRLIFLTVPDDDIADTARKLSALQNNWSGYFVVHCSGNEPSSVLAPLREKKARTAAFHPLQTFTSLSSASEFDQIYFGVEGDEELLALLGEFAGRLEAHTLKLTSGAKSYLHAAAVMASNYLMALLYASGTIAGLGGMEAEQARSALLPLVRQSLENAATGDLSGALSGPIARGDISTVRKHLELLEPDADLSRLYKQLGKQALELAKRKGTLSAGQISDLKNMLVS